jgi:methenyltetrahydromethanopterin cyclohydrolase
MVARADLLGIRAGTMGCGARILDFGAEVTGSYEAGCRLVEACCGGCAAARIEIGEFGPYAIPVLHMTVSNPAIACLGAQIPLWRVTAGGEGADAGGPGRALARKPAALYQRLNHEEEAEKAIICLAADWPPDESEAEIIAEACRIDPANLTLMIAPAGSITGTVQLAGLVAATALARIMNTGFDPLQIVHLALRVPVAPPGPDGEAVRAAASLAGSACGTLHLISNGFEEALAGVVDERGAAGAGREGRFTAPVAEATVSDLRDGSVRRFGSRDPTKILEHFGIRKRRTRTDRITDIR